MVRAGVINHPSEWPFCGFYELMKNRKRYRLIDVKILMEFLGIDDINYLKRSYSEWIESSLVSRKTKRDDQWTESIAVGNEDFVKSIKKRLGHKALHRGIQKIQKDWVIKEDSP
jgi:putative transposase